MRSWPCRPHLLRIADLLDFVIRSTYFQYKPRGEQAIESTPYKPNFWKRYVNDTFTILDRSNVDSFLHHFNSQHSTIRFTMETENDIMIAFLDTSVSREPHGRLTTSVYRKPTHTGQCLAYDSHRPQSVKRGTFKCLYNRAKRLVTKQSVISEEKKSVISSCFKRFCLLLRSEAHQDMKNSPPQEKS